MSEFKVYTSSYSFSTKGKIDFVNLTEKVREAVAKSLVKNGLVHVFAPHATGILILTENEYSLLEDVKTMLERLVPEDEHYNHPSNAYAHLRSVLLPPDRTLPVVGRQAQLGSWQSILFVETDVYPRQRTVQIQVMGEL